MTLLADHHLEGQAALLYGILAREGWLALLPIRLITFANVNLPFDSSDRAVWRFDQAQQMVLLTGNRNMKRQDSLEQTIREENTPTSLPVITIGSVERLDEHLYRERCAARLAEIAFDLDNFLGSGRLFIP
jgi:hypothetical protein